MSTKPGRRGWGFVAVAVVLAALSAVLARRWLPGALASGIGAALAVVAGVWSARGIAELQSRDSQLNALKDAVWQGKRGGRLPRVRDLTDPVAMGVHPAASLVKDHVPPFVARDVSAELGRVLRSDRFVLLVGESTAGKSRAAYEMMRAELPEHRVVHPIRRDAAQMAVACAAATRRTVLWLDDLERFLGSEGLTGEAVRAVLDAKRGARYIVATMRSEEYAKFTGRSSLTFDGIGRDALRQGWDVLRLASRIDIPRTWSKEEIARARHISGDARLADAVSHAGEYGIAEYLAAGPQLLAEWRDAWAPATHPRAAAIVLAAVDARRAGVHRPLTLATVLELHEPYLRRRGGERLRPESIEAAMAWATTPLYATSSLLIPSEGGFLAFDYLIDTADHDRVPAQALDALIAFATPGEALDIGQVAWSWSLIDQADTAFQRAEAGGLFEGTTRRCSLIGESQGSRAGLRFAEEAADWTAAVYGPDHPQTLDARSLIGWQMGHGGDPESAVRLFRNLAARCQRVVGADQKLTLDMRVGEAAMTGAQGDQTAAAKQYERLADDCARILGEDHYLTISCRDQAAMWDSEAGNPIRATQIFRALLADMTERFCSRPDDLFHTRSQLACCLTQTKDYDAAIGEWEQLVADTTATYGRLRSNSFYVRMQHAWCIGEAGDPERAVKLLERLASDATALDDPRALDLFFALRSLAWWIGETGETGEAERQFRTIVDQAIAYRSTDDHRVANLRLMLAHWQAMNDPSESARSNLQQNVTQLIKNFGPGHEVARAALRHLAK